MSDEGDGDGPVELGVVQNIDESSTYDMATLELVLTADSGEWGRYKYSLSVYSSLLSLKNGVPPLWTVTRTDSELSHCFKRLGSMDPLKHPLPELPDDPWLNLNWISTSLKTQSVSELHQSRAVSFQNLLKATLGDSWLVHHGDFSQLIGLPEGTPYAIQRNFSTYSQPGLLRTTTHCRTNSGSSYQKDLLHNWEKVGRPLGKGCFGTVYLGQLDNAQQVAVKVIDLATIPSNEAQQAFEAEFEVMQRLSHPNIVQYLGHRFDPDVQQLQIFLELCSGGTVAELVQKVEGKRLRPSVMQTYTRQVLCGLEYLHSLPTPVVHRDIKGANLLVTKEGFIKLADFGCSKMITDMKGEDVGMSTMVGTPYWMAPEVIAPTSKGGKYGTKCDIWSLGCTIIEMLGVVPWSGVGDSPWEIMYHIANANTPPPNIPENIDPRMSDFLFACLERDPSSRPSAAELSHHEFMICPSSELC
eukprot:TRINITY_DN16639_c0_g2_i2.p1 TRINITY_DN16639_c0_g2~~TRINITY_DN16639_c0_g2_i2.p1  ORF type:complete len:471 (+),score=67.79 TRINITY_DN16639_c0_g2_i2:321-1733(+)